jgi:hypothetical protein
MSSSIASVNVGIVFDIGKTRFSISGMLFAIEPGKEP